MSGKLAKLSKAGLKLHRLLGLHDISTSGLSERSAKRLRRIQIRGAIEQMRVFVVGNTVFAPVLSFQAWNAGINAVVVLWTLAMLVFSWWLFWSWRTSFKTDGRKEDMAQFVAETRLNASLWCLGMILFYPVVEGDAKAIVTTVMAGSLALGTVGFSQAPLAAFWYLLIHAITLTTVPFYHGVAEGTSSDLLLGLLALFASGAIFNAALERAKAQMRAFRSNEALTQQNEVVDLLLKDYEEQGAEWIWRTNEQGELVSCPKQVSHLLELDPNANNKVRLIDALRSGSRTDTNADIDKAETAMLDRSDFHDVNIPMLDNATGASKWINMRGRPQFDGERFVGYRGIFADATATIEAKRQIEYLAEHDPLTGIYNRNLVHQKLSVLDPDRDVALVYLIDLDGFKQVNDNYGHLVGDQLLKVVAQRTLDTVGADGIVARLGGDEFFVLTMPGREETYASYQRLGAELIGRLSEPCVVGNYDISVSASIGVAKFPNDTNNGVNLLNLADLALYTAKQEGRDRCVAFVEKMQQGLQRRRFVSEKLREAVQQDKIYPVYQPQFCTRTGRLVGFEALARWMDSDLGFVGPDVFIPIAEETGLIHEMGESLLNQACHDIKQLNETTDVSDVKVAVNLSAMQVARGNIVSVVKSALEKSTLAAERLELEVTESVLIGDMEGTRFRLNELSELGVSIALDDFGTGYSSLSYVRKLPLDKIKIDRSFVLAMPEPEANSIIETIVGMCKKLKIAVVAEGVETEQNVRDLSAIGCDVLQGYHFAKPMLASELKAFCASLKLDPLWSKTESRAHKTTESTLAKRLSDGRV